MEKQTKEIPAIQLARRVSLILIFALSCFGSTIASVSGTQPTDGLTTISSTVSPALSFSFSQGFSNVSISLSLSPLPSSGTTAIVYLTTQIGPGTTSAEEVATSTFTFPASDYDYVTPNIELFSGLTLAPNTYYLTFSNTGGTNYGGLWSVDLGSAVVSPGVTVGERFYTTNTGTYAPAASYSHQGFGSNYYLPVMRITGDSTATPEPSTLVALGFGLLSVATRMRKAGTAR